MRCPHCAHPDVYVLDSRPVESAGVIRRRRGCERCGKRFTTYERVESAPLMVIKSDNRREPFSRTKLREGIARACQKRPIASDTIEKLVSEVEYELQDFVMEVPTRKIGEMVLHKLYDLDSVAYVRFASVYRQFSDLDHFLTEVKRLAKSYQADKVKRLMKEIRSDKKPVRRRIAAREEKGKPLAAAGSKN